MTTAFQDTDINAGWEEVLNSDKNRLEIAEIQDNYPDKKSLFISYSEIDSYNPDLALFILDNPDRCLTIGEKVLKGMMPATWDPASVINIRIKELPRDAHVDVRNLRAKNLEKFVAVEGLV